jgi:hypothetical protein
MYIHICLVSADLIACHFPHNTGNDDGTWEQCIIQVRCRDLTDLSIKKIVNLKLRGSLVDDEAQDWIDAIRQAGQKRELWSGDTLKEIRPIAKASEVLYVSEDFCL